VYERVSAAIVRLLVACCFLLSLDVCVCVCWRWRHLRTGAFQVSTQGSDWNDIIGVEFIFVHHIFGSPFTPHFLDTVDSFISARVLLHLRQIVLYSFSSCRISSIPRPCACGVGVICDVKLG